MFKHNQTAEKKKKITCCIVGNLGCDQLQCKKKNKNIHTHTNRVMADYKQHTLVNDI